MKPPWAAPTLNTPTKPNGEFRNKAQRPNLSLRWKSPPTGAPARVSVTGTRANETSMEATTNNTKPSTDAKPASNGPMAYPPKTHVA